MKIVYIDAQNIHKSLQVYHSWTLDRKRFFIYCKEKFQADTIKIFFWYVPKYSSLYKKLKDYGYVVCFKETLILPDGTIKGNVDIDIAIIALQDYYESNIDQTFLVTWDGDYNSLIEFFIKKNIFWSVLVPWVENSSVLLKRAAKKQLIDIAPMKKKLQKENPDIAV